MSSRFHTLIKKINPFASSSSASSFKANLPILFLHIPKTAGTSFRESARKSKCIKRLIADYGKDNESTTDWLNQLYHHSESHEDIGVRLKESDDFLLTGHVRSNRYSRFFYPYQICVFIRDPAERIVSNFFHKDRRDLIDLNLEEYVESKQSVNVQSRFLGDLSPEYVGFIGLSDRYNESVDLINEIYNLDLSPVASNINPNRAAKKYDLSETLRQRILHLNKKEYLLFEDVKKLFEKRAQYAKNGRSALYGAFTVDGSKVTGRAYRAYRKGPISVDISLNNRKVVTVAAKLFNPIPFDVRQPREGNMGFEFVFDQTITSEDIVSVRCTHSGEPIFYVETL